MSEAVNIRVKRPVNEHDPQNAKEVHANYEKTRSRVDGSRQREGGIRLELGEKIPMDKHYPEQCWKVVDFTYSGVVVVSDFWSDDHIIDYDSFEIEDRNYNHLSYEKAEELKHE